MSQHIKFLYFLHFREQSCRVLDLRPRGWGFDPRRGHCVVSFSKTHLSLLSTGSTQEDRSQHE